MAWLRVWSRQPWRVLLCLQARGSCTLCAVALLTKLGVFSCNVRVGGCTTVLTLHCLLARRANGCARSFCAGVRHKTTNGSPRYKGQFNSVILFGKRLGVKYWMGDSLLQSTYKHDQIDRHARFVKAQRTAGRWRGL